MTENTNKSIFSYAYDLDKSSPLLTFLNVDQILLKNLDCIVCLESSADLLGYTNGGFRHKITVYSEKDFHKPYIQCILVDDLNKVPFVVHKGIKVSPIEVAINDMLESDSTDVEVLYETFAHYYFLNKESYNGLNIPKKLEEKANHFKKQGALFYKQ